MHRPKLLFVTRSRYWRPGNGEATRTATLIDALAAACDLTVFFPDRAEDSARARVEAAPHPYRLVAGNVERPGRTAILAAVQGLCRQWSPDVVLISRLQFDFLRSVLPPGARTVMDTHDLVCDNAAARQREGVEVTEPLEFAQEVAFLGQYDRVLLIQPDDHARVAAVLGERALCVPHPVVLPAQPVRPGRRVIGYGASQAPANRHGLQWFFAHVWPRLPDERLELAGHIAACLADPLPPGVTRRGFVPDIADLWSGIDLAINPVRWGSGLKIKTVEAMAAGLPLVTTPEGARGLEDLAGKAFLVARHPADFAAACRAVLDDESRRVTLARAAHQAARDRFTPEACFGPLLAWLNGIRAG